MTCERGRGPFLPRIGLPRLYCNHRRTRPHPPVPHAVSAVRHLAQPLGGAARGRPRHIDGVAPHEVDATPYWMPPAGSRLRYLSRFANCNQIRECLFFQTCDAAVYFAADPLQELCRAQGTLKRPIFVPIICVDCCIIEHRGCLLDILPQCIFELNGVHPLQSEMRRADIREFMKDLVSAIGDPISACHPQQPSVFVTPQSIYQGLPFFVGKTSGKPCKVYLGCLDPSPEELLVRLIEKLTLVVDRLY
jgi:hypothetical protein